MKNINVKKKCEKSSSTSFDLLLRVSKYYNDTSVEKEGFDYNDEGTFKKDQDNTDKEKANSVEKVILCIWP